MARGQRSYSDEEKAYLILMCQAAGYPHNEGAIRRVAREQKVKERTLYRWMQMGVSTDEVRREAVGEIVEQKKLQLTEMLENALRAAVESLPDKIDEATYKDTGVVIGILTDKLQLLNGQPTESIDAQITFIRRGISTLPEHLASSPATSIAGSETV